jgi:hypothetical protein
MEVCVAAAVALSIIAPRFRAMPGISISPFVI